MAGVEGSTKAPSVHSHPPAKPPDADKEKPTQPVKPASGKPAAMPSTADKPDHGNQPPVENEAVQSHQGQSGFTPAPGSPGSQLAPATLIQDDPSKTTPGTKVTAEVEVEASSRIGVKGFTHGSASVSNSLTETDDQGRSWNKYTVDVQGDGSVGVGPKEEQYEVTQNGYTAGRRFIYEAKVPSGTTELPNPYDPATIPNGGSIMVRNMRIDQKGGGTDGEYGPISGGLSYQAASGKAVSVENKDGTYRVSTGNTDLVEAGLQGGVGKFFKVNANIGQKTTHDQMQFYDFDSADAAREYIRTGIPPAGQQPGKVDRWSKENAFEVSAQIEAELGPVTGGGSFSVGLGGNSHELTRIQEPSGKVTYEVQEMAANNRAILYQSFSSDGERKSSVVERNMTPQAAATVSEALSGQPAKYTSAQDLVLNMNQGTAQALIDRANLCTPDMFDLRMRDPAVERLANAKTTEDVNAVLFDLASRGQLPDTLWTLYQLGGARPIAPGAAPAFTPSYGR